MIGANESRQTSINATVAVNSHNSWKGTMFLNKVALDTSLSNINISALCQPGLNTISLGNPSSETVVVKLQIDLNDFTDLNRFIKRIPDDISSFVDLSSLSIDGSDDLSVIGQKCCKICPIMLRPIDIAVKSRNCRHLQPFDALSFLNLAIATNSWKCPICGYVDSCISHTLIM